MKIAVLFGGTSEERDVSIASAAQRRSSPRYALGHEVRRLWSEYAVANPASLCRKELILL